MFQYSHTSTNYNAFIHGMAHQLDTSISKDNTLVMPSHFAKGYFKNITLPSGIECLVIDCELYEDASIVRMKSSDNNYVLHFDIVHFPGKVKLRIDDTASVEENNIRSAAILTSSFFDLEYMASKGTKLRSLNILMKASWINKQLALNTEDQFFKEYIGLKIKGMNMELLDAVYRTEMDEIFAIETNDHLYKLKIERRVLQLIELFFKRLRSNMQRMAENKIPIEDIHAMLKVESMLVEAIFKKAPTIVDLSIAVDMSTTRLKTTFKELFGVPVYTYFQQCRLNKAKDLLLGGNKSVKEIGMDLGFTNLGNFTNAFKKQFSVLPSEVMK